MYLKDIFKLIGGNLYSDVKVNKIKTNSKEISEGDLFIAINSGHDYIIDAINNGASAIISEKDFNYDIPKIIVNSTIESLGKIAKYIRSSYNIPLIAITGSVGKTTTKELIYSILSEKYKVLKSLKNQNNHIGLPLTLFNLDATYDVIVVELGMNHFNEISYLSQICKPDYAIITNIGSAHIGNLGSKKNILKAKLEILDGLNNGYLIVNKNDKYLKKLKYPNIIKVNDKTLKVKNLNIGKNVTFDIDDVHFIFNSYSHLLDNVFIAIKIGLMFDIDLKTISEVIKKYQNIEGRLNIIKNKYTIIDDSYNSSFESLIGGLKQLENKDEFKIAVLGDMLELGKYSNTYHKKINKYLKKIKNKEVLLIGKYTNLIKGKHFDNVKDIISYIKTKDINGSIIYVKGSHAFNLDKIKDTLNVSC